MDDEPDNLTVLRQMQGYAVRPGLSGEIALKTVQIARSDLILLDIQMPGIDGYEICRRLKANEETVRIPMIFISALDELSDKVKAFSDGGVTILPSRSGKKR